MSISKFDKQLLRRITAATIDVGIVILTALLVFIIISVVNIFIFNLFKTSTYFIFPVIFYCYFVLMLGGTRASTIGMALMSFELRIKKGDKFSKKKAFIHTSLFYLTLPIGIISLTYFIYPLLNDKRSCMHDLIYQVQFHEKQINK